MYTTPGKKFIIRDTHRGLWYEDGKLTKILQAGKYESAIAATFAEGDWNRDGLFDSADLLMAAATDRFEAPP